MARSPDGPTFVTIDGEEFETISVTTGGKTYVVRELSIDEDDQAIADRRAAPRRVLVVVQKMPR